MNDRQGLTALSFSIGTWFGVRVRVNIFIVLLFLWIGMRLNWGPIAGVVCAVVFVSILLHEFGHIMAARMTGGSGDEVLLWPFGGLAFVNPAPALSSHLWSHMGGIIVNASLCLLTAVPVYQMGQFPRILNLFDPPALGSFSLGEGAVLATFLVNWGFIWLNLIPVNPLDGGRVLRTLVGHHYGRRRGDEVGIMAGFVVGAIAAMVGLIISQAWLVLMGAFVFIGNLMERFQLMQGEQYDDSFMGYDFSQGYTSLEKDEPAAPRERKPGFVKRWKQKRAALREQREREQALETELKVESLLDKIHQSGMSALSTAEKQFLTKASARYREKNNPAE